MFIDPKGLHHTKLLQNEKAKFAKYELKNIEIQIKQERKLKQEIILESFIISDTKYENLIK